LKLSKVIDKNRLNFLIYGAGQAFNLVSPIIIAPYIISICGIDSFGKIGLGFAYSLFLILIVDYAFDIKGTKKVAENRDYKDKIEQILFTTLYTKVVLLVFAYLIARILIFFVPIFHQEKDLFLLSFMVVFAQVFNPIWFLQGLEDFKASSIINILSKSFYVLFIFLFIQQKSDYIWVNFFLGITALAFNWLGLFYIIRKYNFNFISFKIKAIKAIIINDFSFCISQLFLSLRQLSPLFLTSYFFGFSLAGQYKIIEQIISLFRTFTQVYLKFFFPRLCYKISFSRNEAIIYWRKVLFVLFISALIALTGIFIFAEKIVLYFNVAIEENLDIIVLMRFSLLIPLLMIFSLALEQLMFAFNKNKKYIRSAIFVTIINVTLLLILTPIYKLYGVICSIIIAEVFFIILYYKSTLLNIHSIKSNAK